MGVLVWSRKLEVDFVRSFEGRVIAYEVTRSSQHSLSGLEKFKELFPQAEVQLVDLKAAEEIWRM